MKKLSNNNGVIKSSTLAGQRELLREYRNKINEMIEEYDARFQTHEYRINSIAEDKGETMKSIQEKIQPKDYSEVLKEIKKVMDNHTGLALLTSLKFFIDKHNSLIDVLTEQEDRLDRHNDRIAETNKHFGNKIKDLQKEIKQLKHDLAKYMYQDNLEKELQKDPDCMLRSTKQSYTAMRSTGEDYCICKNRRSVTTGTEDRRTLCGECGQPLKPQEDIREKLLDILADFGEWYASDGDPHCEMTGEKAIDRILAIVKGE